MNFDNEIKLCATILKYRITNGGVGGDAQQGETSRA